MATSRVTGRIIRWLDIEYVGAHMRERDASECWRLTRMSPMDALITAIRHSDHKWTIALDDHPIGCYGDTADADDPRSGIPWALGTPKGYEATAEVLDFMRKQCAEWQSRYDYLYNIVDAENQPAINWLMELGFTLYEPEPRGVEGELFIPFDWRR